MANDRKPFFELTLAERIQHLYRHGTFQIAIRYYGHKVNLYLLDGEYIEVFYNHREDRIDKVEALDYQHTRMKFYTDQIGLGCLFKSLN